MDVKRVIVRKPVTVADKLKGMEIIRTTDMSKIPGTVRNFVESSDKEKMNCLHVVVALDTAARLLGFCTLLDLSDFISMYGPDALL